MASNLERKAPRKRQTRLAFNPVGHSSSPKTQAPLVKLSSDDSEEDISPRPRARLPNPPFRATRSTPTSFTIATHIDDDKDDDEDDDPILSSPKRSQRLAFKDNRSGTNEDEGVKSSPPKCQRRVAHIEIEDDEDEDQDIRSSPPRRQLRVTQIQDESEDDDSEPITSPLKRRRAFTGSSEDSDISPSKRHRSGGQIEEDPSDESDDPSPSRIVSRSATSKSDRKTRQQTTRRRRTDKEKTLELLRRRRKGEKIEELTETESESDEEKGGEEFQELSKFDDEEEEEAPEMPKKSSKRLAKNTEKDADAEGDDVDSTFVVDDDSDGPLGIPDHMMIPLQFTHAAHKPLKEHFRDAIEWMILNKINPGFNRDDEIYNQAFKKLHDECYGLAKSKFSSTQWTAEFTCALEARPHFSTSPLQVGEGVSIEGMPKCDACNHRNHQPCCAVQFEGKPYDLKTLEELDQESDVEEDSDGSSEGGSLNINGQSLPKQSTRWSAGNVCKANAEQAHALHHWKYALNEWVVDVLEHDGELAAHKLVEREKMKRKQRTAYGNRLVNEWEATGRVKDLYRDFKLMLGTARDMQPSKGRRGGWK